MTINGQSISRVAASNGVDRVNAGGKDNQPEQGQNASGPRVQVSDRGRQLAELSELVQGSDEVRPELVNEFKSKIAAGEYQVDFDKLASALVNEL